MSLWNFVLDVISYLFEKPLLSDEDFEEIRMLTSFSYKEIRRLRNAYLDITEGNDSITKAQFLKIESIGANPLQERIGAVFGFTTRSSRIDFKKFMYGVSLFNAVGRMDDKVRVAFKLHEFDDDGVISKSDLQQYVQLLTAEDEHLQKNDIEEVCDRVMNECAANPAVGITPANFQEMIANTDFQTKLHIYL